MKRCIHPIILLFSFLGLNKFSNIERLCRTSFVHNPSCTSRANRKFSKSYRCLKFKTKLKCEYTRLGLEIIFWGALAGHYIWYCSDIIFFFFSQNSSFIPKIRRRMLSKSLTIEELLPHGCIFDLRLGILLRKLPFLRPQPATIISIPHPHLGPFSLNDTWDGHENATWQEHPKAVHRMGWKLSRLWLIGFQDRSTPCDMYARASARLWSTLPAWVSEIFTSPCSDILDGFNWLENSWSARFSLAKSSVQLRDINWRVISFD